MFDFCGHAIWICISEADRVLQVCMLWFEIKKVLKDWSLLFKYKYIKSAVKYVLS